ncbi:MAG: hypothetical protein WBD16_12025 [Pyrinomonadaceae bacterium]
MSIIPKLATSLNARDEVPNQQLAAEIVKRGDKSAVDELVENLANTNKGIRYDCIKVLYEIGYAEPKLIAPHHATFLDLLTSRDNRLQWGAMTALGGVAKANPGEVYSSLPKILDAAEKGSVITRDGCVRILITLCTSPKNADIAFSHLLEQLASCPTNQLPMYAEEAAPVIDPSNKDRFVKVLYSRLGDIEKLSKRRRVEKVIKIFAK